MNRPTICINYSLSNISYSETFIGAFIERLPARVVGLDGVQQALPFPIYFIVKGLVKGLPVFSKYSRLITEKTAKSLADFTHNLVLKRFFKKNQVSAMLAEYGPSGVTLMDACAMAGIPLIVHFHGRDAYEHSILEYYRTGYMRMFEMADGIIAVSRDMQKQLLSLGASSDKVHYVPSGVDCSIFYGADPGKNPPIFIAVGRFVDKKGPQLTLLAFKKVVELYSPARLIMIGDGVLLEACKQLAKVFKIADIVRFPGPLSSFEVARMMRKSRAFVQHSLRPSHGDSEGTPVAILEAGASGLPVVSTRHAGIKDSVIHGETGYLVEEGDVEKMAEYMITLATDPNLASSLGKRAREHICSNFTVEKNIEQLWQIISSSIRLRFSKND
jgi:colanic acid/amylovoran biosynthesis glycosyltransferase